jgi:hypothetical protein
MYMEKLIAVSEDVYDRPSKLKERKIKVILRNHIRTT